MKLNFEKFSDGLVPTIVQDAVTSRVLMLGYMDAEALDKTKAENRVTFFSRSRQTLWTKGETSGNFLYVKEILFDCDRDAILIKANPAGPVCHTGADTCFNEKNEPENYLVELENVIWQRKSEAPENSYTAKLFDKGLTKVTQKVGEEAVETVIAALAEDEEHLISETADLLYHLLVLLAAREVKLEKVLDALRQRKR
jgi:phosphoribosyl-ATP pyrophosphohydrolase/phosphoribosyl-AMP cyclohydrolase